MSSTRNSRNLLVNVFRPSYSYGSLTGFTPALSLSNIDTITAETVVTSNLNLGDASQNLFLGSNSGNLIGNNTGDTGIGYNAAGGISNVRNSVAIGKNAMTGVTDSSGVICIGVDTIGGGTQSIYIGSGTRASGANNILLGTDISLGSVSNRLVVGNILQGDQSNRSLDICTNQTIVWGKMGIQRIPQRSFEVLGDTYSTDGFVTGSGSVSRPAFRFELDNSTGLYWPGSNKFALAAGGVQRMVADTSTTIVGDLRVTGNFSAASGGGGGGVVGGIIDVSGVTFSQYIRDSSTNPIKYDISGGNISNSGTTRSSNFVTSNGTSNNIGGVILCNAGNTVTIGNGFITDISTTPYLRLGTTVSSFQVDMSGGNISNSATTTSSNFTTPTASTNTIGGVSLSGSNVSNVLTMSSTNALVSGYMRNALTPNQFDISGGNISNSGTTTSSNFITVSGTNNSIGGVILSNGYVRSGGSGLVGIPAISFSNDTTTGLYLSSVSNLGITTAGTERIRITSNGLVGFATSAPQYTLDVSGISQTCNAIVSGYIRNALTPNQFDISGGNISNSGTHLTSNLISGGYLRNALTPNQFDISGGNISNSGTHLTSNLISGGYLRNALTPTQFDISGGNLTLTNNLTAGSATITGALSAGSFSLTTLTTTNILASGYIRNALTPSQFDISGGNISNSGSTRSTNFFGDATAGNSIGGVTLSNGYVRSGGNGSAPIPAISFTTDTTSGLYLSSASNMGIVTAGTEQIRIKSDGFVGIGTTNPTFRLDVSGNSRITGSLRVLSTVNDGVARFSISNNGTGYLNIQSCNAADSSNRNIVLNADGGYVGVGTITPAYTLDVCGSAGSASMNLATWPRASVSNVLIVRGVLGSVGNTINFSNAGVQNTIDPNIMTAVVSNGTTGGSFKFLKSGIWNINFYFSNGSGDSYTWMDVSTNDVATVGLLVAGSPMITCLHAQTAHNPKIISFTGYLPGSSANFYKFRQSPIASLCNGNTYYLQMTFLYETPTSPSTFPY